MKGKKCKLSIIIPVYQVDKYLSKCLNSVFCQKYQDELEVICVYDTCQDKSFEILRSYSKKYCNMKVVLGRNKGLSGARNDGVAAAKGELLWFVDADDSIMDGAFERIWKEYEKAHFDILVFGTKLFPNVKGVPPFYIDSLCTRNVKYDYGNAKALFKESGAKPFVWRNCYRREFLLYSKVLFDEENQVGEDLAFQLELFPKAKKIIFIRDRLYRYMWRREGSLQDIYLKDKEFQLKGHILIVEKNTEKWRKEDYSKELWQEFYKWSIDFLCEEIPAFGNWELTKQAINAIGKIQNQLKIVEENCDVYKLPDFFEKELSGLKNMKAVNRASYLYIIQHALSVHDIDVSIYLAVNRVTRRMSK